MLSVGIVVGDMDSGEGLLVLVVDGTEVGRRSGVEGLLVLPVFGGGVGHDVGDTCGT